MISVRNNYFTDIFLSICLSGHYVNSCLITLYRSQFNKYGLQLYMLKNVFLLLFYVRKNVFILKTYTWSRDVTLVRTPD